VTAPKPIVLVGIGELGGVLARGFLRAGHPVVPVTRALPPSEVATHYPDPELVMVAVGETDLSPVLRELPSAWRDRVGLLQNELLPRDWRAHGIEQPTVAVIWFEKKKTSLVKQLLPSVLYGPRASVVTEALRWEGIDSRLSDSAESLELELVTKNLYILVTNIAGLETGGTVSELLAQHRDLVDRVATDVLAVQFHLLGRELPRSELFARFEAAVAADPTHACTGRSAPARLARALAHARAAGIGVPELARIAEAT
jgi:ketopantoate reductase